MMEKHKFQPVVQSGPVKEDIVESVKTLDVARSGTVVWFEVKLKGRAEPFALHMNWFGEFGELNVGDRVSYVESKAKLGKDGGQGIDKEGWLLFDKLRKMGKEKLETEGGEPEL